MGNLTKSVIKVNPEKTEILSWGRGEGSAVMSGDRRYVVSGSINVLEGDNMWEQKDGEKIRSRISRGAR